MIGWVYFTDGHKEQVIYMKWITKACFHVYTCSGMYAYKEEVEHEPILYHDSNPIMIGHIKPIFGKYDVDNEEWVEISDIKLIEIFDSILDD